MRSLRVIVILLISVFAVVVAFGAPAITSISPAPQTLTSTRTTEIVVNFDTAIDSQSVNASTVTVWGKWSGKMAGQFQLENGNARLRFTPAGSFSAGEWVTVSLSRGVKSQVGDSLAKGYAWNFWIKSSPGSMNLVETGRVPVRRTGEGHIQTYGAYAGDVNHDGWTDFLVPNEISRDVRVFMNDGAGRYSAFTVYPIAGGNTPSTNEAVDLNGDGIMDFAVGNAGNDSVSIFIGVGDGTFLPSRNYYAANSVRGLSTMDLDGDGDMDVVTANRLGNNLTILKNNGNGTFAPRTTLETSGGQETACAAADANGDGILDLFVGAYNTNEIILMLGNGLGGLTFSAKVPAGGKPWKITIGDVNGDGNVDVVSSNSFNNNASVVLGNGAGGLSAAVTYPTGSFDLSIVLGDIDGDNDLDMVTSNYGGANWTLYENNGSGVFINQRTLPALSAGSCATLHDRDNDGDLDMTGIDEEDDVIFLFNNNSPTNAGEKTIPLETRLHQNYPNPFNPTTVISYQLTTDGFVTLKVFDVLGREVAVLINGEMEPGKHDVTWNAHDVAAGVYVYQLKAGEYVESKKLVLIK